MNIYVGATVIVGLLVGIYCGHLKSENRKLQVIAMEQIRKRTDDKIAFMHVNKWISIVASCDDNNNVKLRINGTRQFEIHDDKTVWKSVGGYYTTNHNGTLLSQRTFATKVMMTKDEIETFEGDEK